MKKKIIFVLLMFVTTSAFALQSIEVKTGYGYTKDKKNNILCKSILPRGVHNLQDEYTYVEVNSQQELDSLQIYAEPKSDVQLRDDLIQQEIQNQAVENLKKSGKLNKDGTIVK